MTNRIGGINLFPNTQKPQIAEGHSDETADVRSRKNEKGSVMTLHFPNSKMRDTFIMDMCDAGAEETKRITGVGFHFHAGSLYTEVQASNKCVVVRAKNGSEFEFEFLH